MFGSFSKLSLNQRLRRVSLPTSFFLSPLNRRKYSSHIIRRTPPILQDIQTQLSRTVDIRMKHLANKLHSWRFVGVLLFEVHYEAEGAVFEGCIGWADDDCVPECKIPPLAVSILRLSDWYNKGETSMTLLLIGVALAYHVMTLSAIGLALTPAGGSVCMRLKSRISLRRAAVDIS